MPTIPSNQKCAELGCRNNKSRFSSFCLEHGGSDTYRAKPTKARRLFNEKYNTRHWQNIRDAQLSKHPLCAGCLSEGIVTAATQVDHVFPWASIGDEAFYQNIFQSLCHSCHSSKTVLEQRGIYRRYGKPTKDLTRADYALVMADLRAGVEKTFET